MIGILMELFPVHLKCVCSYVCVYALVCDWYPNGAVSCESCASEVCVPMCVCVCVCAYALVCDWHPKGAVSCESCASEVSSAWADGPMSVGVSVFVCVCARAQLCAMPSCAGWNYPSCDL